GREVSTAVSARAFRDVRQAPPSRAAKNYLGFGENQRPESEKVVRSAVRTLYGDDPSCGWALTQWTRPISAAELQAAENVVERSGRGTEIVTGAAFSDSAIKDRSDLGQYRILH